MQQKLVLQKASFDSRKIAQLLLRQPQQDGAVIRPKETPLHNLHLKIVNPIP